ncbi:MAG: glycosyltransferase family 4 protein [Gammaproteobacteria bacterium]|nr:glycosyltransferase family 4 protein [Gammaproteobacteria bacterium]
MRIGFGATVWAQGILSDHLDGIGVYTERLWNEYVNFGVNARAVTFGVSEIVKDNAKTPQPLECLNGSYKIQAAYSLMCGLPFRGTRNFSRKFDVFHATDHYIPKLHGIPVVATIMDAIPFVHPEWVSQQMRWAKNAAFKRSGHWAEHVITISQHSKHDIVEAFGINEKDISVIPLGFDESFQNRLDDGRRLSVLRRYGVKENFFIFVGTLQPRKNVRRIIQAHRSLSAQIQNEYPLVIVGNYGWGDDTLLHDIKKMERQGHGRWLRWVSHVDLVALMQSAKSLVYPSLYEGFGLPILEGFAAGIPVISSTTTSIPEVAGDAALLVDPLETGAIAHAMQRIVEDEALAMQMVQRGTARLAQFSWSQCAKSTLDVYEKVL